MPHADDGFHVEVGGEENDDTVWSDFGEFGEEVAVVAHVGGVVSGLEAGGDGILVAAAGDDEGEEGSAGKGHGIGFLDHGGEAEHFGVHVEGRNGAGGDNDGGETVEDRFYSYGGIETGEVEDWVGHGRGFRFEGFEDEEETCVVCSDKRCEGGDLLQRLVVFNVGKLKRADKRCQALGAKSSFSLVGLNCVYSHSHT